MVRWTTASAGPCASNVCDHPVVSLRAHRDLDGVQLQRQPAQHRLARLHAQVLRESDQQRGSVRSLHQFADHRVSLDRVSAFCWGPWWRSCCGVSGSRARHPTKAPWRCPSSFRKSAWAWPCWPSSARIGWPTDLPYGRSILGSITIAHISFSFPFAAMVMCGRAWRTSTGNWRRPPRILGASEWQTFRDVLIPYHAPRSGLAGGLLGLYPVAR